MQDVDKVAEKHDKVDMCHRRVAASFETDFQTLARAQRPQPLSGISYFELWHHSDIVSIVIHRSLPETRIVVKQICCNLLPIHALP
jgi:hypothetical protein